MLDHSPRLAIGDLVDVGTHPQPRWLPIREIIPFPSCFYICESGDGTIYTVTYDQAHHQYGLEWPVRRADARPQKWWA